MIHRHPKNSPHVLLPRLFHTKNHCKGSLTLLLVSVFTSEPFIYVVFFFFQYELFQHQSQKAKDWLATGGCQPMGRSVYRKRSVILDMCTCLFKEGRYYFGWPLNY